MKQTFYLLTIIFILAINSYNSFSQTNHIWNSSFENGPSGLPNAQSQFIGLNITSTVGPNDWVSQSKIGVNVHNVPVVYHSPDWYGPFYYNLDALSTGGAHSGTHYVGMGAYELFQQEISALEENKVYALTLSIQLTNHLGTQLLPYYSNIGHLKVYLHDERMKYESGDGRGCSSEYISLTSNPMVIADISISPTLYPLGNSWYKVCVLFTAPDYSNYWMAFSLEGICEDSYVLIDDIKVESVCDLPCIPSAASEPIHYRSASVDFSIANAGLTGPSSLTIIDPHNAPVLRTPWHVYIKNALGVEFTVFDLNGHVQISNYAFSTITLNDPVFGDYLLVWQGDNSALNTLPNGAYPYILRMWNCIDDITISGHDITLFFNEPVENFLEEYMPKNYEIPTGCCLARSFIQNTTTSGSSENHSHDYTYAGTNVWRQISINPSQSTPAPPNPGPVIISSGSTVEWTSEREINLEDGFSAEAGSSFEAKIDPCGTREIRLSRNSLRETSEYNLRNPVSKKDGLYIYPNPFHEIFSILNSNSTNWKCSVYSFDGKLISENWVFENQTDINLKDHAAGAYFIKIQSEDKINMLRAIKN